MEFKKHDSLDLVQMVNSDHINRLGKYNFKAVAAADEIKLQENGLRALRKPKSGFGFKKN